MAILARNLCCRALIQLRHGVLSRHWTKKNSCISCLKSRDYNSLLGYIPKTSFKSNQSDNSQSSKGSERNDSHNVPDASARRSDFESGGNMQKRIYFHGKSQNQNQMQEKENSSFGEENRGLEDVLDHHLGCVENDLMPDLEEIDDDLMHKPGDVVEEFNLSDKKDFFEQNEKQGSACEQDAGRLAITLLATRALTASELRKKLLGKKFSTGTVEVVIKDFQTRGLVNDDLYAETFCRSRWSSLSWGPRRIKQALLKKGIREVDADKAVKLVFEDGEPGNEGRSVGLSKHSMDRLFVQATKQWLRGQDAPKETRKSRIVRWLQYRGFNWGVISFILKKLESQYPP